MQVYHYCSIVKGSKIETESLFYASNSRGEKLLDMGCKRGSVLGSFSHIIDSV